jgi:hypothetical protein
MPYGDNRIGAVQRGEIDAIFDEGASAWGNMALDLGMTFLSLDETILQRLESVGLRRGLIEKTAFRNSLEMFRLSTSAAGRSTPLPRRPMRWSGISAARLDESKGRIPWAKDEPLPMRQIVTDTAEGHLEVPLHPAAQSFWRERGYLS